MLKYHIQTIKVGASGASSITFSSIPQNYDDLVLELRGRSNAAGQPSFLYKINGSSSGYSSRVGYGYSGGQSSGTPTTLNSINAGGDWGRLDYEGFNYSSSTANTFSSISLTLFNYTSSTAKTGSFETVTEDANASPLRWWLSLGAPWHTGTSPITSLAFALYEGSFAENSSISLYGIKRGFSGQVEIASGGTVSTSGGFTIHTFTASGTFTANRSMSAEVLVVAGGGPGGYNYGGGGGAGGVLHGTAISLTAGQSYAVTVGAGGSAAQNAYGTNGSNSSFAGATAIGGGAAGWWSSQNYAANNGGSGGGGGMGTSDGSTGPAGLATQTSVGQFTGYGNNGGTGYRNVAYKGGGGGGATAVGGSATADTGGSAGSGGAGLQVFTSGTGITYAGGGGGSSESATPGEGGVGGGGRGAHYLNRTSTAGTANTGGGGGGGLGTTSYPPSNGGSGIVIIRYMTPAF